VKQLEKWECPHEDWAWSLVGHVDVDALEEMDYAVDAQ
jgi:hypothetical protein